MKRRFFLETRWRTLFRGLSPALGFFSLSLLGSARLSDALDVIFRLRTDDALMCAGRGASWHRGLCLTSVQVKHRTKLKELSTQVEALAKVMAGSAPQQQPSTALVPVQGAGQPTQPTMPEELKARFEKMEEHMTVLTGGIAVRDCRRRRHCVTQRNCCRLRGLRTTCRRCTEGTSNRRRGSRGRPAD